MFKFLRSKAKVFYWVIAATFILFIFLAWGMDVAGSRSRGTARADDVGMVNGMPISVQQWRQAVRQAENNLRRQSGDREITANQYAAAAEQAWDQLVRSVVYQQEIERLGLTATDDEVLDVFRNNPPPELLQMYADETGRPDLERYFADLSNPARDWSQEEGYIRAILPQLKLQEIITAGAVVTAAEIQDAYRRQTGRAVAELRGVLYSTIETEFEPDDDAIREHYEANLGKYRTPAQARVQVVVWPKNPSQEDLELAATDARQLREEIRAGSLDFSAAARLYSEDPGSAETGGDLGTFDRNQMVAPFTEAAFALPVGEISEPVRTRFGYHLIEVLDRIPGESGEIEQIHARHILFKVQPGDLTLGEIEAAANEFRTRVSPAGFVAAAKTDSLGVLDPQPFAAGRDIPGVFQSARGSNWSFQARPGSISPVFQNNDNFYVVLLQEIIPAGPAPLERVRSQVALELKRAHNRTIAETQLSPAVAEVEMGRTLAEVAAERGLVHAVTDTFAVTSNIPQTGYATAFNEVALAVPVGELVPDVETQRGVFALRVLWKSEFDEEDFAARREAVRQNLLQRKQREMLEGWFARKVEAAQVVDRRQELMAGA